MLQSSRRGGADPVAPFGGALEWSRRAFGLCCFVVKGGAGEVKSYKL